MTILIINYFVIYFIGILIIFKKNVIVGNFFCLIAGFLLLIITTSNKNELTVYLSILQVIIHSVHIINSIRKIK